MNAIFLIPTAAVTALVTMINLGDGQTVHSTKDFSPSREVTRLGPAPAEVARDLMLLRKMTDGYPHGIWRIGGSRRLFL